MSYESQRKVIDGRKREKGGKGRNNFEKSSEKQRMKGIFFYILR